MKDTTGKSRKMTASVVRRLVVKYVRRDFLINVRVPGDCPVVATTEFGKPRTTLPRGLARGVDRGSLEVRRAGDLVTVTSEATEVEDPVRCL